MKGVVSGIYVLDQERSDNAFQAIDSATAGFPDDKRPLARTRLRKSIAVDRMRISIAESRIGIAYDAKTPIVVWIGQEPVRWKLIEELIFYVSANAGDEGVSLTFRGDDSVRTTTYINVGQDLVEQTIITGPLLSDPIAYRRTYKRSD